MNVQEIDEAIDLYVSDRMEYGKEHARERFLAFTYLKHGSGEVRDFLKRVAGLSRYYINFLRVMENPFKGPEFAWFASMVTVAVYACYLIADDDSRLLGIGLVSGTIVYAVSLIVAVVRNWCTMGVMIAIYREIVQLAETEMESAA
ncbi:MAG TPA: hypothetical protein VF799_12325 [Geobacteraceae bacterium]